MSTPGLALSGCGAATYDGSPGCPYSDNCGNCFNGDGTPVTAPNTSGVTPSGSAGVSTSGPATQGSVLTYTSTWPGKISFGIPQDYTGKVFADLQAAGLVAIVTSGGFPPLSAYGIGLTLGYVPGFAIGLSIQVQNGVGFGSIDDVISIIRGAVYQEAGAFPSGDSIPYKQADSSSPPVPTGQNTTVAQKAQAANVPACGDPTLTFFSYPTAYISCLTTKGLSTIGLVAIGIAVGVVILLTAQAKHKAAV